MYYTRLRKWGDTAVLSRIFDPDNWFFKPFGKPVDIIVPSFLWALISAVLLPFGAASTAVYDCASHCLRRGEAGPYARFFSTLKSNLVTGGAAGLIVLVLGCGLGRAHDLLYALADTGSRSWGMIYVAFWVILLLGFITTAAVIVVYVFIWPVLFVPCLWAPAASLPLERIFRPYMQEQEAKGA